MGAISESKWESNAMGEQVSKDLPGEESHTGCVSQERRCCD